MEDWKEYKISDICNIKHGFAFKGQYFTDSKQIYICTTPGNFALKGGFKLDKPKYYNGPIPADYILHRDDLIVTMTDLSKEGDTLGYSALVPQDFKHIFLHNQRIGLIENINPKIDKHFLYWTMRTYKYQRYIVNHCSGGTVKHTSPNNIGSYIFKAPSLEKQKDIASILDNIETKIELNRRINDNLEQQAQALFKAWFVDFEPFKDGKFLDSELGRIPEGWKVGHFTDIVKVSGGGTPKTNNPLFWNGSIPFFTPKDASDIVFTYETEKHITDLGVSNCNSPIYPAYTVFITARGTIGKIRMAGTPMAMNQSCYALLTTKEKLEPYIYLLSLRLVNIMRKKANGAVFEAITTKDFEENIVIPPNEILTCFTKLVNPLFSQIHHNGLENQNIVTLRDTLLPQLMSGELRINTITE